jgi:hypothetical protein
MLTPRNLPLGAIACALLGAAGAAGAADPVDPSAARIDALQRQLNDQSARLDALKRSVSKEEASLEDLRRALGKEKLSSQRARGVGPGVNDPAADPAASPTADSGAAAPRPVGQAPETESRAPAVAQIFEQPGVLTPKGTTVLDPSLQYSYSSSNRVALVGYTVIPAILIGLIDVREVKRNTATATLTGRFGLSNRFELEARLPYVYRSDTSVGREIGTGTATSTAFNATGQGIGDVEVTGRYQFNDGGADRPYYIGSLRLKSRTGKDPFEVLTSNNVLGLREGGVQTTLPTGSGFYGLQPALTVLFPSDPAVFFGTVSYLYSFKRTHVTLNTDSVNGPTDLGTIQPGGVFGFNFGMGLGLNEKSSFSIGYDHASVAPIKQNGSSAADAVRVQLGTLLLGYSYRLSSQQTLSVSLGAGLTRDTPDVSLTVRMPVTF